MTDENPKESAKIFIVDHNGQYFENSLAKDLAFFINSDQKMLIGPYSKGGKSILEVYQKYGVVNGPLEIKDTLFSSNVNTASIITDICKSITHSTENADMKQLHARNIVTQTLDADVIQSQSNLSTFMNVTHMMAQDVDIRGSGKIQDCTISNLNVTDHLQAQNAYIESNIVQHLEAEHSSFSNIECASSTKLHGLVEANQINIKQMAINGIIRSSDFIGFTNDDPFTIDSSFNDSGHSSNLCNSNEEEQTHSDDKNEISDFLKSISIGPEQNTSLSYNNSTGVFTYVPPFLNELSVNGNTNFGSHKILYANMYPNLSDLPNAASYHGMFVHVHATGKAYYAHSGKWVELANALDVQTLKKRLKTYPAITQLDVTQNTSTSYRFMNQYGTKKNPTIYAISGTTISFDLNVEGHPFLITDLNGVQIITGLIHVDIDGEETTGSQAQGKTRGTLYWQIPAILSEIDSSYSNESEEKISFDFQYQCLFHSIMKGVIRVKSIAHF